MHAELSTLEAAVELALRLSPVEKIRLLERVTATLERDFNNTVSTTPRRSLYGIWSGVDVSPEDIDEARREMWANFPREDI